MGEKERDVLTRRHALAQGGSDAAAQPVETLLAALIGCEQATAAFVARHMQPRMDLMRIDFIYYAERDNRGAVALPLDEEPPGKGVRHALTERA